MSTRPEAAYQSTQFEPSDRDRLILEQLPQVHYIAARIRERLPHHVPFEDLVNAGVLGLIEAMQKYDAARAVQFKTYAKFRIRGAILDSLRELDWGSRSLRRKGRAVEEASVQLEMRLGRQPTEQEIADEMHIGLKDLHELLMQLDGLSLVSQEVSAPYDKAETRDVIENAPSTDKDPFEELLNVENKERLGQAIAKLDEREQRVLSLYYREELTMKEIAAVLGIAESRVSQLHSVALLRLRTSLQRVFPERGTVAKTKAPRGVMA